MGAVETLVDGLERFIAAQARLAEEHPLPYLFWAATLRWTTRKCRGEDMP